MLTTLVMTVIGPDRPGIVEAVAACVADHGGNWLESRMCHLGGQFAGILRVEAAVEREAELVAALRALDRTGLAIVVHAAGTPLPSEFTGTAAIVELVGQDRPGLLRQVSGVLAAQGVNVEELTSERTSAPHAGGTLFRARFTVQLPPGLPQGALRAELERIAGDLMVDVALRTG